MPVRAPASQKNTTRATCPTETSCQVGKNSNRFKIKKKKINQSEFLKTKLQIFHWSRFGYQLVPCTLHWSPKIAETNHGVPNNEYGQERLRERFSDSKIPKESPN